MRAPLVMALVSVLACEGFSYVQNCLSYGDDGRAVTPFTSGFNKRTFTMYVDPNVRNTLSITCYSSGDWVCFRSVDPGPCGKNSTCWKVPSGAYSFTLQSPLSGSDPVSIRSSITYHGAMIPQGMGNQDQQDFFNSSVPLLYWGNYSQSAYDMAMNVAGRPNDRLEIFGTAFLAVAESSHAWSGSNCDGAGGVVYTGTPHNNLSPGCLYGTCTRGNIGSFYVKVIAGKKCETTPNCKLCAWPYAVQANGCGCIVDADHLQPEGDLIRICAAWSNTAGNDGTQYYYDRSRSNFNPGNGDIRCAASSPTAGKTVFMPAGKCPLNDDTFQGRLDSAYADSVGDSLGTGSMKDREPEAGTGGGSGGGSGSDTATHSRLDSIIGILSGPDTSSVRDSLRSWQNGDSSGSDSIRSAGNRIRSDLDSLTKSYNGDGRWCWTCVSPPPETLDLDFTGFGAKKVDTVIFSFSIITDRMPFDPWATMRWAEWVVAIIALVPVWVRLASGVLED